MLDIQGCQDESSQIIGLYCQPMDLLGYIVEECLEGKGPCTHGSCQPNDHCEPELGENCETAPDDCECWGGGLLPTDPKPEACCEGQCVEACNQTIFGPDYIFTTYSYNYNEQSVISHICENQCPKPVEWSFVCTKGKTCLEFLYGSDDMESFECRTHLRCSDQDTDCIVEACLNDEQICCTPIDKLCNVACNEKGYWAGYDVYHTDYPGNGDTFCKCVDENSSCVPNCSERQCGPDPNCGYSCGNCGNNERCVNGECQSNEANNGIITINNYCSILNHYNQTCSYGEYAGIPGTAVMWYPTVWAGIDCDPVNGGCQSLYIPPQGYGVFVASPGQHNITYYNCTVEYPQCTLPSSAWSCELPDGSNSTCACDRYQTSVSVSEGGNVNVTGCY